MVSLGKNGLVIKELKLGDYFWKKEQLRLQ
jgi:hypothetical protein